MKQFNQPYIDIIKLFSGKKVLVLGDIILDVYLKGISNRLSPEAPVPVVDIEERESFPGGAANTVCNLKALGASVDLCSLVGEDEDASEIIGLLESTGISTEGIIKCRDRKTITKTRIVAGTHVIARMDTGTVKPADDDCIHVMIELVKQRYHQYDAIILSDYDKGTITQQLVNTIAELQKCYSKFLVLDSKRLPFFSSLDLSMVKPNYEETVKLLNLPYQYNGRAEQVKTACSLFSKKINAEIIAVTLDEKGSVIIQDNEVVHRCFAPSVSSPHVSGAGDTYLSAFVLSYISCSDCKASAEIATAAAAVTVRKESTSVCSNAELSACFSLHNKYVASAEELKTLCDSYHAQGRRIIFTNGCFDILHSGHVTYLHCIKQFGDVLIVAINTDESIKRLKGKTRPVNPLTDRMQVLAGLEAIDHIISFGNIQDDTPVPLIKVSRPHIFAKGGDYTIEKLPEAHIVEQLGGQIVFVPHVPDHSTTGIIQRINAAKKISQPVYSI